MSYCFTHPDDSVRKELHRIARKQARGAVEAIDECHSLDETVHAVRKHCKKLRGLIRLVRPCFADYEDENTRFRDAAASLSSLRDSAVLLAAYDRLTAGDPGHRRTFSAIRRALARQQKEAIADKDDIAQRLAEVRATMADAAERAKHWTIDDGGFDALAVGLGKTYRRARKALKAARKNGRPKDFHDWRKRVKYHGYHAQLLQSTWPQEMKAHRKAAERLGDLLGEHHDLSVFEDELVRDPESYGGAALVGRFLTLLHKRQDALAATAFAVGKRLFAEPEDALVARWRAYWHIWHNENSEQHDAIAA